MTTREQWLNAAAERLNEMIAETGVLKPSKKVLVSAGWPRKDRNGKVIGQCYPTLPGGGKHHVFVSPMLSKPVDVLAVLLHELIHAADNCEHQHTGPFRRVWGMLGFIDKPTTSVPGPELTKALKVLAKDLGKYPHVALTPVQMSKPQTTRMLKVECENCGCVVRMTRKWLEEVGTPTCGCGGDMTEAE